MGPETINKLKDSEIHGDLIGHDKITNIIMFQDSEREFVVTHNANIKPVSYFTGRETELQELRQRIEEGRKSVLVSGMGGIGKTHICRKLFEEYLNNHAKDENEPFQHIGYIEYNGDMGSSLQNCLKFREQDDPEKNQEAAWQELEYLASNGKFLLFVDNVNVSIGEDRSLERLMDIPGTIVLISRRRTFAKEFEIYRVGFLGAEQCREIYERIRFEDSGKGAAKEDVPDLEYIIDILAARHTITIEFLAHLAWTKQWTVQKLRDELEENGFQLEYMDEEDKLVNIQKSYEILYDMSVLTKAEQNIMEAFSVFPYIPLQAGVCNRWLLADAGAGEDDDILMGLYKKGWLQFDAEQERYAMHPVFALFIYKKSKIRMKKHLGLRKECTRTLLKAQDVSVMECKKYIPFVENILEKIGIGREIKNLEYISLILGWFAFGLYKEKIKQGEFIYAYITTLLYIRKYINVEKWGKKYIEICEDVWGKRHVKTAESYDLLANLYFWQGKYKEAEELQEKSFRINKKKFGEESIHAAHNYYNLAQLYEFQGMYARAEKLFEKCLQINKKVLGEENINVAISYKGVAQICIEQQEYEKAEMLLKKSLKIIKKIYEEDKNITAVIYNDLAKVYSKQGKYERSKEFYEISMQIRTKLSGEGSLDMAESYHDLACVYLNQKQYKIAQIYFLKAYKIHYSELGLENPRTKMCKKNLKLAYFLLNSADDNFEQWLEEKMKE